MAEMFSGMPGKFSELGETLEGFNSLLEGGGDDYPEQAFYMVGNIKEAVEKGNKLNAIV
jgi:F-type H+/Na+-transporting ATPase subunit beta